MPSFSHFDVQSVWKGRVVYVLICMHATLIVLLPWTHKMDSTHAHRVSSFPSLFVIRLRSHHGQLLLSSCLSFSILIIHNTPVTQILDPPLIKHHIELHGLETYDLFELLHLLLGNNIFTYNSTYVDLQWATALAAPLLFYAWTASNDCTSTNNYILN